MHTSILTLPVPNTFHFSGALDAHGWVELAPNRHNPQGPSFSRVDVLPGGEAALYSVSQNASGATPALRIEVQSPKKLTERERDFLLHCVRRMLRLDEDLSGFQALCAQKKGMWQKLPADAGRLLRSPSVFEDLVKVLCTTNVQWGGTRRMVAGLVDAFGVPFKGDPECKSFPTPTAIASLPLSEFCGKVRLGYRAAYVHQLALQFAQGDLKEADFTDAGAPTAELGRRLLGIRGIGAYAAASMLMLLGRYDFLPVDTVFQAFMAKKYFRGRQFALPEALAVYDEWGQWKYLAYWFDMLLFDAHE